MPAFPLGQITQPGQHSVSPSGRSDPGRSNGSPDAAVRCKPALARAGVSATNWAALSAAIGALPGLRVLSRNRPSTPASAKCCCQRHTVGRLRPMPWAIRCAGPRSAEQHDARPFHVFLPLVAVGHDCFQPFPVYRADDHAYTLSHELPPNGDDLTFVSRASRCQKSERKVAPA